MQTLKSVSLCLICLVGATLVREAAAQYDWSAYRAQMISPVNGTPVVSSTVTFQWSTGSYVHDYYLALGSSPGSTDAGSFHGTATHFTAAGVPLNGQPLYATLYSAIGGAWQQALVYTYPRGQAQATVAAQIIAPVNGSTLGSTVTFQWDAGAGALEYFLYLGSGVGQNDLFGKTQGLNRSCNLGSIPQDGRALYVRLWTRFSGNVWSTRDYQYRAAVQGTGNGSGGTTGTTGTDRMLRFDGVHNFVLIPIDVSEKSYTVNIWFRTTDPDCALFSATDAGGGGYDRTLYLSNGDVTARIFSEESIHTLGRNYADGQWHRVTHVFGGAEGGQKLYLDGKLAASGSKSDSQFNWQTHVRIGYANDAAHRFFKGDIYNVAVWDEALSAAVVATLGTVNANYAHLMGYWTFDEDPSSQDILNSAQFGPSVKGTLGENTNAGENDPTRVAYQ